MLFDSCLTWNILYVQPGFKEAYDERATECDPAPNLPSLISRIFSGYGPNWGGLQTRWV